MHFIVPAFSFSEVFRSENLLSPQAFFFYALAFMGLVLWIVAVVLLKGRSKKDVADEAETTNRLNRRLADAADLVNGLHDKFSGLEDEFKFFKEKLLVKVNANARLLELLPVINEQMSKASASGAPSEGGGDTAALESELTELKATLEKRDEKIRSHELEIENFHKIIEGKTLDNEPDELLAEARERIRLEREEFDKERTAFQEKQEKIKKEIQLASEKLRDVQEKTRRDQDALEEERNALEQEKNDLAQMGGLPQSAPADDTLKEEVESLLAEREAMRAEMEELRQRLTAAPEAPAPPKPQEPSAEAKPQSWGEMLVSETGEDAPAPSEDGEAEKAPEAPEEPALAEAEAPPGPAEAPPLPDIREGDGIEVHEEDGILQVRVNFLDVKRPEAQELIDLVFSRTEDKDDRVVLDFSRTNYVNSSGMSAITKIAVERNCQIVLTNKDVLKVIDLMGFLPLLNINETYDEAMEAFAAA